MFKEYAEHDATGLAQLVSRGEVTAAELLEAAIARAEAVNPKLNAINIPMLEAGRARAAENPGGPFAGVPFLIKDIAQDYAGVPTTSGSRALRNWTPVAHASIVERFLAAGVVVFGKTSTPEFALKALTETCNVKMSCQQAGMGNSSAYGLRHRDAAFAQLWDDALAIGYDRLEALLLQRALEGVNDIDVSALVDDGPADDNGVPAAVAGKASRVDRLPGAGIPAGIARGDVQLALALLNRRGAKHGPRDGGRKAMSSDEVDALLTRKLDALARRRGLA